MIKTIGETAGKVFTALNANGEMTIAKLKTAINTDAFLTNAAVGWLAREDKVNINLAGKSVKVSLK